MLAAAVALGLIVLPLGVVGCALQTAGFLDPCRRVRLEYAGAVRTKDGFAQPLLVLGLPLVLRRAEPLEALHPQPKERPEIRQHSCRDVLHILDWPRKRPDVPPARRRVARCL